MGVSEIICSLETSATLAELQDKMQAAIGEYGFSAYNFFDAGKAHLEAPYFFGTTGNRWEEEYRRNDFVRHDHTLSFARRTNVAFAWREAPLPTQAGKRKPGP